MWKSCMRWWDVHSCVNSNIREWYGGWTGLCMSLGLKRVWETLFNAVVWMIWEARNQVVFKGIVTDFIVFRDIVRFRVAWDIRKAGIGGVLRNAIGEVWCEFVACVKANNAVEAEFLEIKKACILCVLVDLLGEREIIIESDIRSIVGPSVEIRVMSFGFASPLAAFSVKVGGQG
ncbi:hypothetical protein Q3G72_024675 [Acer saccharum]|nr:hypothetical protein Q3G72_024675 [Acer saccharum]